MSPLPLVGEVAVSAAGEGEPGCFFEPQNVEQGMSNDEVPGRKQLRMSPASLCDCAGPWKASAVPHAGQLYLRCLTKPSIRMVPSFAKCISENPLFAGPVPSTIATIVQ